MYLKKALLPLKIGLLLFFSGCSTIINSASPHKSFDKSASWAIVAFENHTETTQAGERAQSIAESTLYSLGVKKVTVYSGGKTKDIILESEQPKSLNDALIEAKNDGARYALIGSVYEWRYKVGVDGEPAVGMAIKIVDLQNDEVLYSSNGGLTGWSRESLAGVASKLMLKLLEPANIKNHD